MPPQITTTTRVQVSFTVSDPDRADGLSFTDALYFDTGQVPSNSVLRSMGLTRYQAWRTAVDTRPPRLPRAERLRLAQEAKDAALAQATSAADQLAAEQADPTP